jgi:hypothetical protein
MRKMIIITTMAMVGLFAAFISCKKDKAQAADLVQKNYFTIQNATFETGAFPSASSGNAPSISAVTGNGSILEGGSNPITISTSASLKAALIGVKGKTGYYQVNASDLKSNLPYMVYLLFSTTFVEDNFTIYIAIIDINGLISTPQEIPVTRVKAGTGKLQVSVSWDKPNDIDLHLVEPKLYEIYWDTVPSPSGGTLDVDSNPICYLDNINNENITYSGTAILQTGKYIVRVSLFSSCDVTDLTHYLVTARMDGNLITPTTGTNPYYGSVAAADSWIDGDGPRDGVTVMEFNVAATKSSPAEYKKMLKFSYPRKPNLIKRALARR